VVLVLLRWRTVPLHRLQVSVPHGLAYCEGIAALFHRVGAVSAPGTGTAAGSDQPAQPAKKVWSGFWSGFGKRNVGANEPGTVSA
jgi:hypothetical protein